MFQHNMGGKNYIANYRSVAIATLGLWEWLFVFV